MNRRVFLKVLGTTSAIAAWGSSLSPAAPTEGVEFEEFDAGPLDNFEENKVYDQYRDRGFFLIRRADEIFAMSSICTHKGCKVRAQSDQSYLCKCHGSRFDPQGHVLNGPAKIDLPRLKVKLSGDRNVLVRTPKRT